ncbi:MAG: DUF4956 domain-containing protein [Lachnospiraceae bacterium]|nr:DUF4956 domain-containing protein [Lachnospiraceae bacterium]
MSITDVLKKSLLEGYASSSISVKSVVVCMVITALIAVYIFVVYRYMNRNAFYNKNFNISLPALAIITAAIILTIQSSIVISLGMVGALSIVRFRTAIKDPMDLVFLFWAISAGIICGAGYAVIAVIASVVLTVGIVLLSGLAVMKESVILLVNADEINAEKDIIQVVEEYCSLYKVKARNLSKDHLDMAIEVKVKEEGKLIIDLMGLKDVTSASLLSHEGEVTF